jgi:oligopeptidase B
VDHWNDHFVILTNADGAVDWKLVTAPVATPGKAHWKDSIAHQPGTLIVGMIAFKGHWSAVEKVDAVTRIVIRPRSARPKSRSSSTRRPMS